MSSTHERVLKGYGDSTSDIIFIPLYKIDRIYQFDLAIYIRLHNYDIYKIKFEKGENQRSVITRIKKNAKEQLKQKLVIEDGY